MDAPRLDKRQEFAELLVRGIAALHLDGRMDGVRVPQHLRTRAWLVLNFSYGYQISDFCFDDDGVQASLTFGGRPFPCFVPWEAVFAMSDDSRETFQVWREDVPPEATGSLWGASEAAETGEVRERPADEVAPRAAPPATPREDARPARAPAKRARGERKPPVFAVIDGGGEGTRGPGGHLERIK